MLSGGIAKAFGLDDGPTHRKAAIVKGRALGDTTYRLPPFVIPAQAGIQSSRDFPGPVPAQG
jgi:hypothetical protein